VCARPCLQLTLELNDEKWPKPSRLAQMWAENERVLLEWPLAVALGGEFNWGGLILEKKIL